LTTTTGAIQLWHQDKEQWTREESLATIGAAEFVELPEEKVVSSHVGDDHEHFLARLGRQLLEARVRVSVSVYLLVWLMYR
jgi:ER membrane protein complex subunit 1